MYSHIFQLAFQTKPSLTLLAISPVSSVVSKPPQTFRSFVGAAPVLSAHHSTPVSAARNRTLRPKGGLTQERQKPARDRRGRFTPRSPAAHERRKPDSYFGGPPSETSFLKHLAHSPVAELKFNSSIFKRLKLGKGPPPAVGIREDMLPSMPSLGTPLKRAVPLVPEGEATNKTMAAVVEEKEDEGEDEEAAEKDNEQDIAALMVASSTIGSKKLTAAERRKARARREFGAHLAMLAPDSPAVAQEKAQSEYMLI